MAEIERSALMRDLPQRVGDRLGLAKLTAAWEDRRNRITIKANWQFTAAMHESNFTNYI